MKIVGHQKQWQFLKKSVELKKLSHAYLFSGEEKLGKKTVALEFIKLICGKEDVFEREHPDLFLISPEIGTSIQINQIRELNWKLSLKPSLAPFKVALLDKAHLMNEEAQNCLLKTLEEPRGNAILILISEQPERLFPTILSRCQIIKFFPVKRIEIEEYLKAQGFAEKIAKEITELSLGRPGQAMDLAARPQKIEEQKQSISKLLNLARAPISLRFQLAKEVSQDYLNLREVLEIWMSFLRKALISRLVDELRSSPRIATARVKNEGEFREFSISKLKALLWQIQNLIFLISTTNVNPRLALEIFLLEI